MSRSGFLAILGALSLGIAVLGCGTPSEPAGSGWSAVRWERIDPSPGLDGPLDVVAFGGRYVGVGGAAAWTSSDLRTWRELDLRGGEAVAVTEFDGALVAVGAANGQQAAVWRSDDGEAWVRLPDESGPASVPGYASTTLVAVAADPDTIVAVGTEWGDAGQRPAAWLSTDGRTWERVAEPFEGSGARDVLAMDDGFVMTGAGTARTGEMTRTAFWTSVDGRRWEAVAENESFGNREPSGLARLADGRMVAGGLHVTPTGWIKPALWTSADGSTWSPAPDAAALSPWAAPGPTPVQDGSIQGTSIAAVEAVADGCLAVGQRWGLDPTLPKVEGSSQMSWRAVVWHAVDGVNWDLLADDPLFALGVAGGFQFGPRQVRQLDGTNIILGVTADGATIWLSDVGG